MDCFVATLLAMTVLWLQRRDHFLHQPGNASDIAGRIDAVAEPHHDEALWRHDLVALAEVAGRKERIARHTEPHAALRVGVLAAVAPEAGGVIGVERRRGAEIHPALMQDAFAADDAVIEVEQAEL